MRVVVSLLAPAPSCAAGASAEGCALASAAGVSAAAAGVSAARAGSETSAQNMALARAVVLGWLRRLERFMKIFHATAIAFALACVPTLALAQQYSGDEGYYDDSVDSEAQQYDNERYDDPRYADERAAEQARDARDERYARGEDPYAGDDRYADDRYADERYDPRYDERRGERYEPRYDERYDHGYAGHSGHCNPHTDHGR